MILVIFDNHNLGIWCFEESVCRNKMRKTRRGWKESPQFEFGYGGFYRRFNFNFRFEFEYRITVLSRGTYSNEFQVVKMIHMRCNPWEKTPTKISHSTSSCTGPDGPAAQCLNFRSKSGWSGPGPDDPDLVTFERPEQHRSDDLDLRISVCV